MLLYTSISDLDGELEGNSLDTQKEINQIDNDTVEIDLKAMFLKIKSLWYVCVIGLLVGALCGVLYYTTISTPKYESTAMVYLRSSSKKLSLESLQLNTSLTQDYQIIFTSRPNLEETIKKLNLKYDVDELKNMITIENPDETRILEITVKSTSKGEAKNIANTLMECGMDDIREVDSQEPYVIESAVKAETRTGLNLPKMTAVCGLIGLVICLAVIIIRFMINDTFTSSDDIENTLGLPVLAVIAEDKNFAYAKLTTNKKKGRRHHEHTGNKGKN